MPFPWKKNRVTRLSQIVADLQSPKRGGSLVVETGFPTSLIDLFVKNKGRFKKPKSKKPVRPEVPDPPPPPPSPATTPPPTLPDPPAPSQILPHAEAPTSTRSAVENADAAAVSGRVDECGACCSGSNLVVGVFVKMLVVVCLIASLKRLTVGITVSAFALVFLEYAGKRVVSCLGPCSYANAKSESLSKRVYVPACVLFQKLLQLKGKNKGCHLATVKGEISDGEAEFGTGSLSIDEIEVVETKSEECCFSEFKWGYSELVKDEGDDYLMGMKSVEAFGISECKTKGSRSARFKSKMVKKLVPKKFRGGSKKGNSLCKENEAESCSEVSSALGEDKLHSFEIEEEAEEEGSSNRSSSLLLITKLECVTDDEVGCGITCSRESQFAREDVAVTVRDEENGVDGVGNSGYTILLVTALAGLVLGRVQALILTVTWCFILKIVNTLWRSYNVPLIPNF